MTPEQAEDELNQLKYLLWLRHGCSISVLYGDDGEMQCNSCFIDFKRMTAAQISERFRQIGIQNYLNANIATT